MFAKIYGVRCPRRNPIRSKLPLEDHFEDIFCTNTAYVALSRLIFVRICEDVGLTTRKISNSGIAVWRDFVRNIKGNYQDLLDVAFKDVASVCPGLFEPTIFDCIGQGNSVLDDILERILFRLNAFSFREMNRDLPGSMYHPFRPHVERRYTVEDFEYIDFIHDGLMRRMMKAQANAILEANPEAQGQDA